MSEEEKPIFLRKDQRPTLERAKDLLREAVEIADDFLTQLKILGETSEERALTLEAFEGLTPEQLREAAIREKELLDLHKFLKDEEEVKP
jgi:hypothetical protein